ncbi:MAG: hypothetical protein LBT47_05740 [Deltaproteobacteria bacterium]|nr:hypothetical protein [Deltaproteobacteria bacterium]
MKNTTQPEGHEYYRHIRPESYEYYRYEGLDKIFNVVDVVGYGPNEAIDINNITPFLPDLDDLVRLHQIIR